MTQRLFDIEAMKAGVKAGGEQALRLFEGERSMCALRRMGPGEIGRPHFHPEADEWLVCLEGQGEYYVEKGQSVPISTGQVGFAPAGAVHGVRNTGKGDLVYIFGSSPNRVGNF